MNIVMYKKDYLKWLPYAETKGRADIYLRKGRPFDRLSDTDIEMLRKIGILRNAIAHKSEFSIKQFKKYLPVDTVSNTDKSPEKFLRAKFRSSPDTTYFENYTNELRRIASKINP